MNMCAGSFVYLVVINLNVFCMAISSALKLVCRPGSLFEICISTYVWVVNSIANFFFLPMSVIGLYGWNKQAVCVVAVLWWEFKYRVFFEVW